MVEAALDDPAGDRGRNESLHGLAALEAGADIGRRDVGRRNLEKLDALRTPQRREHGQQAVDREARPRGDPEADAVEDRVRLLPGRERAELIGADAPRYLPWLLDDMDPARIAAVLGRIPEPLRVAYRDEWQAQYADVRLWAPAGA